MTDTFLMYQPLSHRNASHCLISLLCFERIGGSFQTLTFTAKLNNMAEIYLMLTRRPERAYRFKVPVSILDPVRHGVSMEVLVYLGCALLSLHFPLYGIMESGVFSFPHRGATVTTSSATQSQRFRFHKKQSQSQNVPLDKSLVSYCVYPLSPCPLLLFENDALPRLRI
ncbi:hypothetical protein I7I53_05229 [Histoplasma capsulatum var. duboisii H88]|uniref:Uncharacterized protein n=1 Tax=Ajellomyces capsulatus (strain H88) TaxID=544711 RepID=A0A8A1LRK1_AJEC8|nr:hypothetical protein I7I53_05229 [Histoplasma capsulatum var. duboisii H88]